MTLKEDVAKQIEAGFSYTEIKTAMMAQGHTHDAINDAYYEMIRVTRPQTSGKNISLWGIISIIISVLGIISFIKTCSQYR